MAASPYHIQIILLLLPCIITLNLVTCSLEVHCNKKDMNTLLKFKQGVTHPSSLLSSSWSPRKDCCEWEGVRCNNITGRVTELCLHCHTLPSAYSDKDDKSHCLTGELDLSLLLHLEFLSHLDLSNNDFKVIQHNTSVENILNLRYLDLSYNDDLLIDTLSWISSFSSLRYLDLSGIDLYKETDWLRPMTMLPLLSTLHLQSCQLQNIYPSLQYANFTSLEELGLGANDFISKLPCWIFNLSSDISVLDFHENHFQSQLSETLSNLRSLTHLNLSNNILDGPIPNWLGQLEQLQELDLSYNSFSGVIPTRLGNLSSLVELILCSNHLGGNLPENLGKISSLEILQVVENFLIGNISERNFHSLSNLKCLSLGSPALIFDFDLKWIPPFQLQSLWLEYVHPKLPSWIYTQNSLKNLCIWNSRSSFEPLDKLWEFAAQLELLDLRNNSINADMSNVLLNSEIVILPENNLRGGVPRVSPNVALLNLSSNSLSGSISPLLCHDMKEKFNLEVLAIVDNILSGEILNCWMDWKSLLHLNLRENNLTGKIPHSMGSLSNLISLNLNGNKLSENVPLSLKDCKNLWLLNLGENNFHGVIPSWLGQSVKGLILRSNQFSGNIPTEICQLRSLRILDFANNRLSGPIPDCLHNMTSMVSKDASFEKFSGHIIIANRSIEYKWDGLFLLVKGTKLPYYNSIYVIDLSSNSLSGTMPLELFMLTRLQSLNLSHNQFVGMIPEEIGKLEQLESLDLSSNRLSGHIPESMSSMSFLEVLNLSFNDFTGKIPSGTQLQGFTNLSYTGNPRLCGPPLTKICTQDEKSHNKIQTTEDDDDDEESQVHSWFYMGLGVGFATGFCGILGVIFFITRCRHAYFKFLGQLYVMVIPKLNSIYYNLKNCNNDNYEYGTNTSIIDGFIDEQICR